MAIGNISQHKDALTLLESNDPSRLAVQPTPGPALTRPGDQTISAADKIALEDGTLLVIVEMISGAIYAYSGLSNDTNLTSGQGYYCAEGRARDIPVGTTDGVRHTHLLVVPAA